jgi:Asp-tRNA(Asn)/Glu-tRNA(Gln) amidotransferase A subunit family amidase
VYGIKPSSGRLPYHGVKGHFFEGAEVTGILCVSGVIAISLRDCELLLRTISEARPWLEDPGCAFLPWKAAGSSERPLVFGVIREDPESTLLPPVERVLTETADRLRIAGHEVVELEFHKCSELNQVALNFFRIDGGRV